MIQPLEFIITVMLKVADTSSTLEWIYSLTELKRFRAAKTEKAKRNEKMQNALGQMSTRYLLSK